MDERPDNSQQLMDILLVMDKEEKTIQAVSGVQDGKLQTKNPLEDNNDLLKVDRHGDMFSNFFSNLWSQLKDPTRFHFFRCAGGRNTACGGGFSADSEESHTGRAGSYGTIRGTTTAADTAARAGNCRTTTVHRCTTTATTTAGTATIQV